MSDGYRLVLNARVDTFFAPFIAGAGPGTQLGLVPEALERANAYFAAGADCVYPIGLWEHEALRAFMSGVDCPVNVVPVPGSPALAELAELGVARVSWAVLLYRDAMTRFAGAARLASGLTRSEPRVEVDRAYVGAVARRQLATA